MSKVFQKIDNSLTLSQIVVKQIEEAIVERKFTPGDKLPTERELCEAFGVSRTVVREAMQILSAKGLVTIKKGSGAYVKEFDAEHLNKALQLFFQFNFERKHGLHLIRVRQIIEPYNAKLAAENRTDKDAEVLENIVRKMEGEEEFYKESELDRQFHIKIAESTSNPIISIIMYPVFELMPKIKTEVLEQVGRAKTSAVQYHAKISDRILAQDGDGAFEAMKVHLQHAEEHIKELL
ncbi:MAG: FadR family transcriptional regulator [Candidatus Marinimicrobia bacterium]|nr:FadR family transcriptional regulator [Candidatus Neomarinimicrobiota bacterium]MCF7828928.1 FadR family transcriptional regulator [Candidatus Neomarinimicrobiota bacterium]MCF7879888.1 FadR family transcriptional regulator [Candidatus Neomarinimicrobiota bacterium]